MCIQRALNSLKKETKQFEKNSEIVWKFTFDLMSNLGYKRRDNKEISENQKSCTLPISTRMFQLFQSNIFIQKMPQSSKRTRTNTANMKMEENYLFHVK